MTDVRLAFSDLDDDFRTEEEVTDMNALASGEIHIIDIGNYTLRHIASMSLSTMRVYMNFLQNAYPVRLKAMHIINCPTSLNHMMAITRPFIHEEVYKMVSVSNFEDIELIFKGFQLQIHFHTEGIERLYEHVPRDMLPTEYGGKAGSLSEIKTKIQNVFDKKR